MESIEAMAAFGALAQPTRLAVFRLLMARAPDGLPAGRIAEAIDVPHNTLSTHLGILARAGLIRARRESRLMIYAADTAAVRAVLAFFLNDCCGGRPEVCAPAAAMADRSCIAKPLDRSARQRPPAPSPEPRRRQ